MTKVQRNEFMLRYRFKAGMLVLFLMSTEVFMPRKAMSKIGDPSPIVEGHVKYRSHANYVEAIDIASGKVIWHTDLYASISPDHYDPKLEEDVQRNVITSIALVGDLLQAQDKKGRMFRLDRQSGKTIESLNDQSDAFEGVPVTIESVSHYLLTTKGWKPSEYRLVDKHPELSGSEMIIGAIYLADEKSPQPGGGQSLVLYVDRQSGKVIKELRMQ